MRNSRDAEPVGCRNPALAAEEGQRPERRVDRSRAERPRQLAEPVRQEGIEVDDVVHVVLMRGNVPALIGRADPDAEQLSDLFLERELGEERFDAVGSGCGDVVPCRHVRRGCRGAQGKS